MPSSTNAPSWSRTAPRLLALMVAGTTPDIDDSFTRIDDALFNLAQQQGSNGGVLMDGLRVMRSNRSSLVAEWGDLIRQSLDDWGNIKPAVTSDVLSLVDDDDLERSLAIDQMAEVFAKNHERDFSHLNQAWAAVAEALTAQNLEKTDNNESGGDPRRRADSAHHRDVSQQEVSQQGAIHQDDSSLGTTRTSKVEAILVADCPAHPHGLAVLVGRLVDKLNLNMEARLIVLKTFERSLGQSLNTLLPGIVSLMVEERWISRNYVPTGHDDRSPEERAAFPDREERGAEEDERGFEDGRRNDYRRRPDPRGAAGRGYGARRHPAAHEARGHGSIDDPQFDGPQFDDRTADTPYDDDFPTDTRYPVAPRGWNEHDMAYGFTPYGFAPYGFGENRPMDGRVGRRVSNRHGYDEPAYERGEEQPPAAGRLSGEQAISRQQLAVDLTKALSRLLGGDATTGGQDLGPGYDGGMSGGMEPDALGGGRPDSGMDDLDVEQIDPAAAQLVSLLQRRRATDRSGAANLPGGERRGPPISPAAVRSVLDVLQQNMPEPVRNAARANDASLAQQFKDEMLHKATEIGVAEENSRLGERDEDAVDIVGMLFEVFLSERAMTEDTREHIARLLAPYVKAALSDRKLFLQRTHPARRLLDSLAEACDGNMGSTPQERDILLRVGRAIDEVVREYNEDEAIFSEAEKEIRDFITSQRRVAALAEQRAEQALKGKERLEEAKTTAHDFFEKTLGDRNWPVRTVDLLRSYWCQHHTMTILRSEPGAPEVDASKRLLGGLVDIGTRGVSKAAEQVRALHPDVVAMLGSSGLSDQSAVDAAINLWGALDQAGQWTALAKSHGSAAAQRAIPEPAKPEPTETAVAFALFQARQAEARKTAGGRMTTGKGENGSAATPDGGADGDTGTNSGTDPSNTNPNNTSSGNAIELASGGRAASGADGSDATGQPTLDSLTDYFDKMPVGAWVDFVDEYGRSTAAKLSWISPISRKRLFVTIRGLRHATETPDDLAMMVVMKRLHIRDVGVGEYGFDHSYRKALEELDQRVAKG